MALTGDWVAEATFDAMHRLPAHAEMVGLPNTDECTLRAFFMAATRDQLGPGPQFRTEWRRFDLLVQNGELATIIESKNYLQRRTFGLHGEPLGFKGGPGPKNEAEFHACVHKLRTAVPPGVTDRRLILVCEKQSNTASLNSFSQSYRDLAVDADLAHVHRLTVDKLEARVIRPTPGPSAIVNAPAEPTTPEASG